MTKQENTGILIPGFHKKIEEKKFTVPLFGNVYLEYKTDGEFSDYLERIEILPAEYKYWDGEKEKSDEYHWKADFYFSKNPTSGELFIEYL